MTTTIEGEVARGELIVLREKRIGDAANDYRWRTDVELARFDAARPFAASLDDYVALFKDELAFPSPYRRSLAIEDAGGRHIGNVMYYNIDTLRQEAELGITIGEHTHWNQGYGSEAVGLLLKYLLGRQGYRRVYLKTLTWNKRARRAFAKAGFRESGKASRAGNEFVLMEVRQPWLTRSEDE